ncbi:type VII secretion protein EccCa, partial [Corynebacterium sp. 35RC1]|nr:type VII secretion protein EccCa [Corynebacterium sp. 35RC1]
MLASYPHAFGEAQEVPPVGIGDREPAPPRPQGALEPHKIPEAHKPQPMSLLRAFLPMIMVVAILGMVALMVLSGAQLNPMMLMFPLMMGLSAIMMFSPPPGEDTNETRRTYLRHLAALREQALANARAQREHELHYHPAPQDLRARVGTRRMWERGGEDPDMLAVRVGLGNTALEPGIQVGDPGAPEDLDPVCAVALRQLVRAVNTVGDMPIVVQLSAFPVVQFLGEQARDAARAVIAQIAVHHGPEAVGLHAVGLTGAGAQWGWTKWLPHTRNIEHAQAKILLIDGEVDVDPALLNQGWACIVVAGAVQNADLAKRAELEGLVLRCGPKLEVETEDGVEVLGVPDRLSEVQAELLARSMTGFKRPSSHGRSTNDLRKLLGIGEITAKELARQWVPRGKRRLSVPIGLSNHGAPLVVDIKESAHGGQGPHGLCVGATGSGKSELLRSLVVVMAATHSPDDLNFVLVDFKGGATFLGLEHLPHTSAVITNLSEEAVLVERMHDALAGEMHRRQEVLRQAGNFANATEYNQARSRGEDLEPMPALFVVVDEFSELLGQHPDFADLFVAIGRLGRSLHIHLLLASQRLEEGRLRGLEAHLSYRIGLKTFSAAESRQVLGIPDAYQLPSKPGTGFYKTSAEAPVGFRAAYVSGPLMLEAHNPQGVGKVRRFDGWDSYTLGGTSAEVEAASAEASAEMASPTSLVPDPRGVSMLGAFVQAAAELGEQMGSAARKIWLPPLPKELPTAHVVQGYQRDPQGLLRVPLGILDRPFEQRQDTLVADLRGAGGHVVVCGGPQTGKSTVLRGLMLGAAVMHTTAQMRMYVLDLAGTALASTTRLPHVAGVAHRGEEEKVHRVIDEVMGILRAADSGSGTGTGTGGNGQHTLLVIDGWHALAQDFEERMDDLATIAADGLAVGVHLVVSMPRWSAMRPTVRDLMNTRYELKLGEALDSLICRKTQEKLPALPGRGITTDKEMVLFGLCSTQDVVHVAQMCAQQPRVEALKMLPQTVDLASLLRGQSAEAATQQITLGIGGPDLAALGWDYQATGHLVCVGGQGSGKSTLLATVLTQVCNLGKEQARVVLVDHRRTHLGAFPQEMLAAYSATTSATEEALAAAAVTLRGRLPSPEITAQQLKERSWWQGPEIFLAIDDLDLVPEHLLHEFVELIPHARDIGLHIIIARKIGGATRALYQPFLQALRDQSPTAVVLSGERDDGPIFGVRPSAQGPGRGSLAVRGKVLGAIQV